MLSFDSLFTVQAKKTSRMQSTQPRRDLPNLAQLDEDEALRTILEGTAIETGPRFFTALVENLAKALHTHGAWVTEYLEDSRRLRAPAFWMGGEWVQDYEKAIAGTPCEAVVTHARLVHYPDKVLELFPDDEDITTIGAVSYLESHCSGLDGKVLGHLAVLDRRPMPESPRSLALFHIFAARAAAELQRLRAEGEVRAREENLGRFFDSAMDAILELDRNLVVNTCESRNRESVQLSCDELTGKKLLPTFYAGCFGEAWPPHPGTRRPARGSAVSVDSRWLQGHLSGRSRVSAEATLSRFEVRREPFYTLILRNVNERLGGGTAHPDPDCRG